MQHLSNVSGEKLYMCKGVTDSDFSYGYDEDTMDFIKNILMEHGDFFFV